MESIPVFPGKQFLQGKEKFVDTGTFTLGTIILINFLNRYSALSAFTYQENFHRLNMEISNMKEHTYLNVNAETTLQMDASKKGPGASLIQKGKDIPVMDTFSRATPMNPEDDIQLPIRKANMITTRILTHISTCILMSVQPQNSLSNNLDRLRKSTAQGNQLTRLSRYTSTGFLCDKKDLPTDLHESWNDRKTLSIKFRMNITLSIICMIIIQCLMSEHSSDSISNRLAQPGKKTSQKKYITRLEGHNNTDQLCDRKSLLTDLPESWSHKEPVYNTSRLINLGNKIIPVIYMQKEVYILSRPSKLQPVADYSIITQCTHREKDQDLPQLPSTLEAQEMYQYTHKEPATVVSQALIVSCKRRVDQCKMVIKPKVYRKTRTMLKIRCTDVRQTRHDYSQLTELEKAKFQTPATSNVARNCVEHNSVENVSQDLVHPTKSDTEASASFDFESEEREKITEIADVPAHTPAPALEKVEEQSHTPGSRKSTRKNLGRPASSFSDFYM